jgi:hypothetical protein
MSTPLLVICVASAPAPLARAIPKSVNTGVVGKFGAIGLQRLGVGTTSRALLSQVSPHNQQSARFQDLTPAPVAVEGSAAAADVPAPALPAAQCLPVRAGGATSTQPRSDTVHGPPRLAFQSPFA